MTIKLDMKITYDKLEWDFIKVILFKIGFHPKWIEWVMEKAFPQCQSNDPEEFPIVALSHFLRSVDYLYGYLKNTLYFFEWSEQQFPLWAPMQHR